MHGFEETLKETAVLKFVLRACPKSEAVGKVCHETGSFIVHNVGNTQM